MVTSNKSRTPVVSDVLLRVMITIVVIAAGGVFLANLLQ